MTSQLTLTVNGQSRSINTDPERPLLDVLREEFQLTGAKYGCGEGQCRACTVLVDGKSVSSCITSIGEVDKKHITTIEGLRNGEKLHPVQDAFLAEDAFQCGYCTPGMILGIVSVLNEHKSASEEEIVGRMQKHICRCGSYPRIRSAIERVAKEVAK